MMKKRILVLLAIVSGMVNMPAQGVFRLLSEQDKKDLHGGRVPEKIVYSKDVERGVRAIRALPFRELLGQYLKKISAIEAFLLALVNRNAQTHHFLEDAVRAKQLSILKNGLVAVNISQEEVGAYTAGGIYRTLCIEWLKGKAEKTLQEVKCLLLGNDFQEGELSDLEVPPRPEDVGAWVTAVKWAIQGWANPKVHGRGQYVTNDSTTAIRCGIHGFTQVIDTLLPHWGQCVWMYPTAEPSKGLPGCAYLKINIFGMMRKADPRLNGGDATEALAGGFPVNPDDPKQWVPITFEYGFRSDGGDEELADIKSWNDVALHHRGVNPFDYEQQDKNGHYLVLKNTDNPGLYGNGSSPGHSPFNTAPNTVPGTRQNSAPSSPPKGRKYIHAKVDGREYISYEDYLKSLQCHYSKEALDCYEAWWASQTKNQNFIQEDDCRMAYIVDPAINREFVFFKPGPLPNPTPALDDSGIQGVSIHVGSSDTSLMSNQNLTPTGVWCDASLPPMPSGNSSLPQTPPRNKAVSGASSIHSTPGRRLIPCDSSDMMSPFGGGSLPPVPSGDPLLLRTPPRRKAASGSSSTHSTPGKRSNDDASVSSSRKRSALSGPSSPSVALSGMNLSSSRPSQSVLPPPTGVPDLDRPAALLGETGMLLYLLPPGAISYRLDHEHSQANSSSNSSLQPEKSDDRAES